MSGENDLADAVLSTAERLRDGSYEVLDEFDEHEEMERRILGEEHLSSNPDSVGQELKGGEVKAYSVSGAKRDTREGKGRFDLIPYEGLLPVARIFELGAKKYGARNWEKGFPLEWLLDSALRHAVKEAAGHKDEDHAAQAAWNLICYLATREWLRTGRLTPEDCQPAGSSPPRGV